jgi:hypothetical protein
MGCDGVHAAYFLIQFKTVAETGGPAGALAPHKMEKLLIYPQIFRQKTP